jgi:polysaccharide biosynthesis/export protein
MNYPQFKRFCLILLSVGILSSCISGKKIAYFQGLDQVEQMAATSRAGLEIKTNDLLTISVAAYNMEAAQPFNLPVVGVTAGSGIESQLRTAGTPQLQTYLVNSKGNIDFPQLGKVNVSGKTTQELSVHLQEKISEFVKDPIVSVRLVNFQVSVLGEVNRPGTFTLQDEYLSLPKALGLAGDLSIYAKRDNILVMREENDKKSYAYLDLSDASVVNSPFYYLQQNDVIYVEPNNAQKQGSAYNRNASVYVSIASVLISLAILITR